MGVKMNAKPKVKNQNPEPLNNKPGFYKNGGYYEEDVCYRYDRFNGDTVTVLNPRIDTLRFTLDLDDKGLKKNILSKMCDMGDVWNPDKNSFSEVKYGQYNRKVIIPDFPNTVLLCAHSENYTAQRFLQVCIHASEFGSVDIKQLFEMLSNLSEGEWSPKLIWEQSRILRMDWCIDFKDITPHEIGMWKSSATRGEKRFIDVISGNSGAEINAKYDKIGQLSKKGKHNASKAYYYNKKLKSEWAGGETTRLEFRTFKEDTSIKDNIMSAGKKSIFKPYEVLDFASIKSRNFMDHEWLNFGDACKLRLRKNAMLMLPKNKQIKAKLTLKEIEDKVWRIEELKKAMIKETNRFKLY